MGEGRVTVCCEGVDLMDGRSKADAEEFVKERGCVACLSRDCDSNLDGCVFSGKTFVSDRDTGGTGA